MSDLNGDHTAEYKRQRASDSEHGWTFLKQRNDVITFVFLVTFSRTLTSVVVTALLIPASQSHSES